MEALSHAFHNETQGFKVQGGASGDAWKLFARWAVGLMPF
jgi:hypothetical protein